MPLYEYDCLECGPFTEIRPMAESALPQPCPECGRATPRAYLTPPMMACVGTDTRTAMETNERAQNAPMTVGEFGAKQEARRHRAGCSCCSPTRSKKKSTTAKTPSGAKTFPSKRPWMISH